MNADLRSVGFSEVRERLTGNRLSVYEALRARGPSTGSELAAAMGWTVLSVRPRIVELRDCWHVVPTGIRRDGEHEFRAVSTGEAMTLHAGARVDFAAEMQRQKRETRPASNALQGEWNFA